MLDELIGRTPDDADAWYNRATLRRQMPEHNHVAPLRAALAARSPGAAPVALHYALAKELEDLGEYAESFAALAQGAAARRKVLSYRVETDEQAIASIIRTFDRAWYDRAGAGLEVDGPIFVVGLPRSGTTLVERILIRHEQVATVGEVSDLALAVTRTAGPAGGKEELIKAAAQHRARGARRVLLDRDPGLRPFAAVRRRQDAAQLPLPRPDREGAAAGAHRPRAAPPDGVLLRDVQDAVPHGLPVLLRPRGPRPLLPRLLAADELLARAAAGPLPRPRLRGAGRATRKARRAGCSSIAAWPGARTACASTRTRRRPRPRARRRCASRSTRSRKDLWRNYRQELAPLARLLAHNGVAVE